MFAASIPALLAIYPLLMPAGIVADGGLFEYDEYPNPQSNDFAKCQIPKRGKWEGLFMLRHLRTIDRSFA